MGCREKYEKKKSSISSIGMINTMQYPENCKNCEDFETCPYPGLMTLMKQLHQEKFDGDVSILFKEGLPSKVSKLCEIEFIRK
jgi:hypothetical protein